MLCFTNDSSTKWKSFWEEKNTNLPGYREFFRSSAKHRRNLFTVTFYIKYLYETFFVFLYVYTNAFS